MQDFTNLAVWNKAHALVLEVYRSTTNFPPPERYGLTAQLRGSAVSVAANLAEGCGRDTDAAFASFVQIAFSSASEATYHMLLARDLGYLDQSTYETLSRDAREVKRMLAALHRTLRKTRKQRRRPS